MKKGSFMCALVLIYSVENMKAADLASPTTPKPIRNRNTTSNLVTSGALPQITTTQRPPLQGFRLPCSCRQGQCGCCTGVILERFKQKACANITYEPDEFAFTAALSINGRVLFRNSISGKNPPPLCIRLPRINFIKLCVEFSNVYIANRNMHVCIAMEASWESFTLLDYSFDCIRLGANGFGVVGPAEGGGFPAAPIDAEEQTDEDYDDSARTAQILYNTKGNLVHHTNTSNIIDSKLMDLDSKYTNLENKSKTKYITTNVTKTLGLNNSNGSSVTIKRFDTGEFSIDFQNGTVWYGRILLP